MYLKFLKLELKSFLRSKTFATSLAMKILLAFVVVYSILMLLLLGLGSYAFVKKELHLDPLKLLFSLLIYILAFDLILKYFFQQLSTQNIKPFLTMNIAKNKVVKYILLKSSFSFFNWIWAFFYVPFFAQALLDGNFMLAPFNFIGFFVSLICLHYLNNFLNILLNGKGNLIYIFTLLFLIIGALDYYSLVPLRTLSERIFTTIAQQPWLAIIPIVLLLIAAFLAYQTIAKSFYLDEGLAKKVKEGRTQNIAFLNKYGAVGSFINNDIRMLTRNKATKGVLVSSAIFLFYGIIFFVNPQQYEYMFVFAGIFLTGGFQFMFGQRIPSFDSSYYPLMMTLNVPYKEYLNAKWWLMNIVTFVAMILAVFYLFFGVKIYLIILACGIYNLGINSYLVLLGGVFNKSPIDLNSKAKMFAQKNSFNMRSFLLVIPQMLIPMGVFLLVQYLAGFYAGIASIVIMGLLGFLLKDKIFNYIVKLYKSEKYKTLLAFKEAN